MPKPRCKQIALSETPFYHLTYRCVRLFAGSVAGGQRAAVLYSILGTAKLNGINPNHYLTELTLDIHFLALDIHYLA